MSEYVLSMKLKVNSEQLVLQDQQYTPDADSDVNKTFFKTKTFFSQDQDQDFSCNIKCFNIFMPFTDNNFRQRIHRIHGIDEVCNACYSMLVDGNYNP